MISIKTFSRSANGPTFFSYKKIVIGSLILFVLLFPDAIFHFITTAADHIFDSVAFVFYLLIRTSFDVTKQESDFYVGNIFLVLGTVATILTLVYLHFACIRMFQSAKGFYLQQSENLRELWNNIGWLQRALICTIYIPFGLYCFSLFLF